MLQGKCLFEMVNENKIKSLTLDNNSDKALLIMSNTPHRITSKDDNSIVIAISSKEYNEKSNDTFQFNFNKVI